MKRRRAIPKRKRIFLGCEGQSEQAYGRFLNNLAELSGAKVHVVTVNLQPAGDPHKLAIKAMDARKRLEREGGFVGAALMLDIDRLEELPDKGRRVREILIESELITIWQVPDHEGFLLRHFRGYEDSILPRGKSFDPLRAEWPTYHKNMAAMDLQRTLTIDHVRRAEKACTELTELLKAIGM
jgi:hypothetical protein